VQVDVLEPLQHDALAAPEDATVRARSHVQSFSEFRGDLDEAVLANRNLQRLSPPQEAIMPS
jgi:hypothetical protein